MGGYMRREGGGYLFSEQVINAAMVEAESVVANDDDAAVTIKGNRNAGSITADVLATGQATRTAGSILDVQNNSSGTSLFKVGWDGNLAVAQQVNTSGTPLGFVFTGAAHTGMTLSTEAVSVNFNLAQTKQFATGALALQRAFLISSPTYSFVGASTLTTAATLWVTGVPAQGTNATITSRYGIVSNVDALGTSTTGNVAAHGIALINTTAATGATTVQDSPMLVFRGTAWDTAASEGVEMGMQLVPASAATPQGTLGIYRRINDAAWVRIITITSAGALTLTGNFTTANGTVYAGNSDTMIQVRGNKAAGTATVSPDVSLGSSVSRTAGLLVGVVNTGTTNLFSVNYRGMTSIASAASTAANTSGTGDSIAITNGVCTLTDAAGLFTADQIGKLITLYGCTTAGNNGTFLVTTVPGTTTLTYVNGSGGAETSSFTWFLSEPDLGINQGARNVAAVPGRSFFMAPAPHGATTAIANIAAIDASFQLGRTVTFAGAATGNSGTGDSIAFATPVCTLTDAASTFIAAHVGMYITIKGASNAGNNGVFPVMSSPTGTTLTYINAAGVAETSSFTWTITIPTQAGIRITSPTYAGAAAITLDSAANLLVTGVPAQGTNATITNSYGIVANIDAIGTGATSYGIGLINNTEATAGAAVQASPALALRSQVWNTTTLTSQPADWAIQSYPSSSATPGANLYFNIRLNNGSWTSGKVAFDQYGTVAASGNVKSLGGLFYTGASDTGIALKGNKAAATATAVPDVIASSTTNRTAGLVMGVQNAAYAAVNLWQVGWNGVVGFSPLDNTATPVAATAPLYTFNYNKSVADHGVITLPAVTTNGHGFICVGTGAATRTEFFVDSTGTVTLVNNTADVVANANTDAKLNVGTAATQEPLQIANELGATTVINISFWYD